MGNVDFFINSHKVENVNEGQKKTKYCKHSERMPPALGGLIDYSIKVMHGLQFFSTFLFFISFSFFLLFQLPLGTPVATLTTQSLQF